MGSGELIIYTSHGRTSRQLSFRHACVTSLLACRMHGAVLLFSLLQHGKDRVLWRSRAQACHHAQRKLSAVESFKRRFFTKSNLSMGIGWLAFFMLVFWASKYGGSETPFFDPYEILQVGHISTLVRQLQSCNGATGLSAGNARVP